MIFILRLYLFISLKLGVIYEIVRSNLVIDLEIFGWGENIHKNQLTTQKI